MHKDLGPLLHRFAPRALVRRRFKSSRTRLVLFNIAAAFVGRLFNLASTLILIPLAVNALGASEYGLLAIVISMTIFFVYADFGLGNAIVNDLAAAEANRDRALARRVVSQVWFFLVGVATAVIVVGLLLIPSGIAGRLLPALDPPMVSKIWALLVVSSAIGIPFALAQRIFFALQKGGWAQMWSTASRLAVLAGAALAAWYAPDLLTFVLVLTAVPTLVSGISTCVLFFVSRPDLRPSLRCFDRKGLSARISMGLQFTLVQICNFAETGIDPIMIGLTYSSQTVAHFDLVTRLFYYVPALISMGVFPLWPALRAAQAQSDENWSRSAVVFARLCVLGGAGTAALLLSVFAQPIIHLWTNLSLEIDPTFVALLSIYVVLYSYYFLQCMQTSASGQILEQGKIAVAFMIFLLPLKWLALPYGLSWFLVPNILLNILRIFAVHMLIKSDAGRRAPHA